MYVCERERETLALLGGDLPILIRRVLTSFFTYSTAPAGCVCDCVCVCACECVIEKVSEKGGSYVWFREKKNRKELEKNGE